MPTQHRDLLSLLREQHTALRSQIKILKDSSASSASRVSALSEFIELLKAHTEAEEQTLYKVLREIPEDHLLVLKAREEHRLVDQMMSELEDLDFAHNNSDLVIAKAMILAEAFERHADEEEEDLFFEARRNLNRSELESLGQNFEDISNRNFKHFHHDQMSLS